MVEDRRADENGNSCWNDAPGFAYDRRECERDCHISQVQPETTSGLDLYGRRILGD